MKGLLDDKKPGAFDIAKTTWDKHDIGLIGCERGQNGRGGMSVVENAECFSWSRTMTCSNTMTGQPEGESEIVEAK